MTDVDVHRRTFCLSQTLNKRDNSSGKENDEETDNCVYGGILCFSMSLIVTKTKHEHEAGNYECKSSNEAKKRHDLIEDICDNLPWLSLRNTLNVLSLLKTLLKTATLKNSVSGKSGWNKEEE